jgi:DNA-binding NarL/FixJ family response regulator
MPSLTSTLRDLTSGLTSEILRAVRSARIDELFEASGAGSNRGTLRAERPGAQSFSARLTDATQRWAVEYGLSAAQVDILTRAALGATRSEIARARGTSPTTVKTQAIELLRRTRDSSFQAALVRLLREVAGDVT